MSWAGQAAQEAVEAPPQEASPGLPDIQPPRQTPKKATRPGCSEPVLPTPTAFLQVSPWVTSKDPLDSGSNTLSELWVGPEKLTLALGRRDSSRT